MVVEVGNIDLDATCQRARPGGISIEFLRRLPRNLKCKQLSCVPVRGACFVDTEKSAAAASPMPDCLQPAPVSIALEETIVSHKA